LAGLAAGLGYSQGVFLGGQIGAGLGKLRASFRIVQGVKHLSAFYRLPFDGIHALDKRWKPSAK
jgi:hypothetical protein